MSKILQTLRSRTFWTLVLMLSINSIPEIKNAFPNVAWLDTVNSLLTLLATYFHVNPTQVYAPAGSVVTQETPNTVSVTKI